MIQAFSVIMWSIKRNHGLVSLFKSTPASKQSQGKRVSLVMTILHGKVSVYKRNGNPGNEAVTRTKMTPKAIKCGMN